MVRFVVDNDVCNVPSDILYSPTTTTTPILFFFLMFFIISILEVSSVRYRWLPCTIAKVCMVYQQRHPSETVPHPANHGTA